MSKTRSTHNLHHKSIGHKRGGSSTVRISSNPHANGYRKLRTRTYSMYNFLSHVCNAKVNRVNCC